MSIETISWDFNIYPKFQSEGFAAKFAFPFAEQVLKGKIVDIGCMRKEWSFPGSIPVDISFNDGFDAFNLPTGEFDGIFSSHCLEHLTDWVGALDYWSTRMKGGGVLFLYLPNMDLQVYWQPANNRKHLHHLTPDILSMYFTSRRDMWRHVFISDSDLNSSFGVMAEKIHDIETIEDRIE